MSKPRKPDWDRDETILAVDLYFRFEGQVPGSNDPLIVELSELLRSNPSYASAALDPTFRNPSGVAFKLQNLRYIAVGEGYEHHSKRDAEVFEEFHNDIARLRRNARSIRAAIEARESFGVQEDELDFEFREGRAVTQLHRTRERDRKVRPKKLASMRKALGHLKCEACELASTSLPPEVDESVFEIHHLDPLNLKGEVKTRLRDVAVLCANCHRLIHRLISVEGAANLERLKAVAKCLR